MSMSVAERGRVCVRVMQRIRAGEGEAESQERKVLRALVFRRHGCEQRVCHIRCTTRT